VPHGKEAGTAEDVSWNVYKIAKKGVRLETVEAPDKQSAIKKSAADSRARPTG
jgi:hypothetical protein